MRPEPNYSVGRKKNKTRKLEVILSGVALSVFCTGACIGIVKGCSCAYNSTPEWISKAYYSIAGYK